MFEWTDVKEIDEPIEVLDEADEIFLMSTTRDIQGVRRYGSRELSAPGPVTRELQELWSRKEPEDLDP